MQRRLGAPLSDLALSYGLNHKHRSPKWWQIGLLISLFFSIGTVTITENRWGNFGGDTTDHLRQVYMVGVATQSGTKIYTEPLERLVSNVFTSYRCYSWLNVPYVYPPGAIALFGIPYMISEKLTLSEQWVGKVCNIYLLILTHVCLFVFLRRNEICNDMDRVLFGLLWLFGLFCATNGIYEVFWMLPIIVGFLCIRHEPQLALAWFGLASFISYRAAIGLPAVLICVWRLLSYKKINALRNWALWLGIVMAGISMLCFSVVFKFSSEFHETPGLIASVLLRIQLFVSIVFAILLWRDDCILTSMLVLMAAALASVDHYRPWFHCSIAMIPLWGYWVEAGRARGRMYSLLCWSFFVQHSAWSYGILFPLKALIWGPK